MLSETAAGLAGLPRPGGGRTALRWERLAAIARRDLVEARLAEGHADAVAILHELGRADLLDDIGLAGVWAAEPGRMRAAPDGEGWVLTGTKRWCSGASTVDAALVTAVAEDGPRLFLVPASSVTADPDSWHPYGMAASDSFTISVDARVDGDRAVAGPDAYVGRPGFWHGGCGVAACWYGGALGLLDDLVAAVGCADGEAVGGAAGATTGGAGSARSDRIQEAAVGQAASALQLARALLVTAAAEIDGDPTDLEAARRRALGVRVGVARSAREVIGAADHVRGAADLCHDVVHARRLADLNVYLRQLPLGPAEADLGRAVLDAGPAAWRSLC